ncbi:uncharacterized protein LOC132724065, partial [Ruditapes philippinarum]|uniref:uncharacterized protein LOC132724065 n=1 Tax=Ruditapes philippinarum TaxID=129788 RepID=UPI00295ADE5B
AVLSLVLLNFQSIYCEFPIEYVDCERFPDFVFRDLVCRNNVLFQIPDRDNFQSVVQETCRNETLKSSYMNCMNALSGKCPEQYVEVAAFLRKKMDMFCDGNDVTQRFQSVAHDVVSFNYTCSQVFVQTMYTNCNTEFLTQNGLNPSFLDSFETASEVSPRLMSAVFHCTKSKLAHNPARGEECGSSWQQTLLNFWLQTLFRGSIFLNLSNEDEQELLALSSD